MKTQRTFWPYGLILTFVVFFAGMATVVTIAVTHRASLVSDNYYEQALDYQQQMDSAARAHQAGASIACDAAENAVIVKLPVAQLAENPAGKIEFYRPSSAALDCEFKLAPAANGTQAVDVSKLAAGLWRVRVRWNAGGEGYFLEQKITL